MDFNKITIKNKEDESINPYSSKRNGKWVEGNVSVDFLNDNFGEYSTAEEMINSTDSEGLKKFFQWLKDEGKLD